MRTIVIGDIHGCFKEVKALIEGLREQGKYTPETDKLVFIGDYIDRGDDPRLTVRYVRGLQEVYGDNIIPLRGNHEQMLIDYVKDVDYSWLYNGYEHTNDSYKDHKEEMREDILWMAKLPFYYEDEHFIYVHAGIDKDKPMDLQKNETMLWAREDFFLNPKVYDKPIIFGHTPTMFMGDYDTPLWLNGGNDIAIDTGCVFGGKLTALIIEDDEVLEYYQVSKLNS